MLNKVCLAFVGALMVAPQMAIAADISSRCVDIAVPKDAIAARNGKWIELTPEQWQFLRGIYVVNPDTPAGLPYGDKAVLAQVEGNAGGLVFFIDGDKACTPMAIPHELLAMMHDVATETINHETGGL
jgi:hypothetical protein